MVFYGLWVVLQRRWWLIVLPGVVVLLTLLPTLPAMLSPASSYVVTMRFSVAAPADEAIVAAEGQTYEDTSYIPWLQSEYVVVNFPQWVTGDAFAREVSQILASEGRDIPADDVRGAFVADSARSILVVSITRDDPDEAEALANAAVMVLQTRNQAYFPQLAAEPAEVVPLDEVRVQTVAPSLVNRFMPLLRLAIALGVGLGLAALAEYLDDRVHRPEDLDELEVPLWAVIPSP